MVSFESLFDIVPRTEYFPEYDSKGGYWGAVFDGIRALAYDGADLGGLHTKVFAHIGFPEDMSGPVPAVVLVHGGGGHPEDVWIRRWTQRGYAAISMDTTGYFPQRPIPHLYEGFAEGLERRLAPPFAEAGYTVGPDNSGMADGHLPLTDQWMYHACAQVILAQNILRADPRIDSAKIGLTGISWGGVIASLVTGFDPRFAFAVPIYGSGFLGSGLSQLDGRFREPSVYPWLAELRFCQARMPVMWLGWNDDNCFSIQSNSLSYLATRENNPDTCLSMLNDMRHSHYHGYTPPESYWFADAVVRGRGVPRVWAEYEARRVRYGCPVPVKSVRLYTIGEAMTYVDREKYGHSANFMKQEWQITPLPPDGDSAPLPEGAVGKYVEFTLQDGAVLTTPYTET